MTTCFQQMHHHLVALALCVPLASATIEIAAGSATGALILSASQVATISLIKCTFHVVKLHSMSLDIREY